MSLRGTRLVRLMLVAAIAVTAQTPEPKLVPVSDSSKRVELRSFSVLPPKGKDWFLVDPNEDSVTFAKSPGRLHSITAWAYHYQPDGRETLQSIAKSIEKDATVNPRFKLISGASISLSKCLAQDCVRYDLVFQDPSPRDVPGTLLILTRKGFVVPYPHAPGTFVWVETSQRYPPGTQPYPAEAELTPFLGSLQFKPAR